jgi:hypothetical protein
MEATCSLEMLVTFHQIIQHYIPEDRKLQIQIPLSSTNLVILAQIFYKKALAAL